MRITRGLTFIAALAAAPVLLNFAAAESAPSTMKAIVTHEHGNPEVLKYEDVPRPEPKEDQILIRVMAAGVATGHTRGKIVLKVAEEPK